MKVYAAWVASSDRKLPSFCGRVCHLAESGCQKTIILRERASWPPCAVGWHGCAGGEAIREPVVRRRLHCV